MAFLRPLVDRALARADLRIATTDAGRDALAEILPGDYTVIPAGVDREMFRPSAPRAGRPSVVLVARGRDRVGVRFALGVLRGLDLATVGSVTLLGPADAPWRTRAAVPKALRDAVMVVPDEGPAARATALAAADIAILATPEDAAGPALREAMAAGCAVLVPRSAAAHEGVVNGDDALVLPPFTRETWARALEDLIGDPVHRGQLQAGAVARGRGRTWDDVASDLELAYRGGLEGAETRVWAGRDPDKPGGIKGYPIPDDVRARFERA